MRILISCILCFNAGALSPTKDVSGRLILDNEKPVHQVSEAHYRRPLNWGQVVSWSRSQILLALDNHHRGQALPDGIRDPVKERAHAAANAAAIKGLEAIVPGTVASHDLSSHNALDSVHGVALHVVSPAMGLFLLCVIAGAWLSLKPYVNIVPDSVWTVMFSATFGLFIRLHLLGGDLSAEGYVWASASMLNLFLLPIIIFQSGWALKHANFVSQIEHILVFAVFGTVISFSIVGLGGQWFGIHRWHVVDDLRENLVFAALISAVDPVATLATFSKLGLDSTQPLLHTMIFGESVINDAVAIVLFHTINNDHYQHMTTWSASKDIGWLLFGSVIYGALVSCGLILVLRLARLPGHTVPETLYIVGSAWFVFALAEAYGFSGIIANLVAGSFFRAYGAQHLDHKGKEMTTDFLEVSAHMADTMVFILCGTSTVLIQSFRGLQFAIIGFILCHIGRALSTHLCAQATNGAKWVLKYPPSHHLTIPYQIMMWHAGLRGGIAITLALEVDSSWCHHKATIINGTFIIICVNLLLLGSTTETMLRLLGFSEKGEIPEEDFEAVTESLNTHGQSQESLVPDLDTRHMQTTAFATTNLDTSLDIVRTRTETTLLQDQEDTGDSAVISGKIKIYGKVNDGLQWVLVGDPEEGRAARSEGQSFLLHCRFQALKQRAKKMLTPGRSQEGLDPPMYEHSKP